jgi:hypothetical protein
MTRDFEKGYTWLLGSIKGYQAAMRGNRSQIDHSGIE